MFTSIKDIRHIPEKVGRKSGAGFRSESLFLPRACLVEAHQLPRSVIGLVSQFCDAAKIHVKVPAAGHRVVGNMTHQQTRQAVMTDDQRIFLVLPEFVVLRKVRQN
jgi:hypothetical protein